MRLSLALRVLQIGAVAVVVATSTLFSFELDRFFVPKELVLHAAALLATMFAFHRAPRTRVDTMLNLFLLLSAGSAALATNRWLGARALLLSVSSVAVFHAARALRESGRARPLLGALALAVVTVAVTSLLQTYGVETLLFSENRAPGGTLGNRNFVAHAAAFGMPLLFLAAFTARSGVTFVLGSTGVAIVTATLVLTRSRAAWLAFAVVGVTTLLAIFFSGPLRRNGRTWWRLLWILTLTGGAVAAALLVPNTLRWRDDNPYLETVRRVADYEEGSGRGRLIQYRQSLLMAARHPLFGVGPGNWAVEYPGHRARRDPSMSDSQGGVTTNPWPSSDWVAFVAERGFVATALLAAAFVLLAFSGVRQLFRAADPDQGWTAVALLGTAAGAVITGMFDAVLLLALPAFLVWGALGALWEAPAPGSTEEATATPPARRGVPVMMILILIGSTAGVVRSASQLAAMQMFENGRNLALAAQIDPGNYRLRLRLARSGKRDTRCAHALAAHDLYPHADAAAELARRCD